MKYTWILLASIGLSLAQDAIVVQEQMAQSLGPICGASTAVMDTVHCANPILMNQDSDTHLAACANSCDDFLNLLSNPPWVSNTEEETLCSNVWNLAAGNITEDRQVTVVERESYNIFNCTTEPACCNNLGNWYQYTLDECGVHNGDGSSCADCAGTPNGDAVLDACNVCNGDSSSCADCAGTPNGDAVLDACDVCNGDGSSCADCAGTPNGNAVFDECSVCDGDGSSCADCAGTPYGDAVLDACGVCNGNSSSCADCEGTPNGNATLDKCDVCNGDGSSCSSEISQLSTLHLVMFLVLLAILAFLMLLFCCEIPQKMVDGYNEGQEELLKRVDTMRATQLEQGRQLKF